ncbi:hypothetical protein [Chitinivorax sp. B]|uniref:hypothetical protein n=1 Tax=Chitinivorax sp. B TaxID=2502235 RepID=UPI0010F8CD6D|nr:hypothetical protein [Chitinivorax sp. B]
MKYTLIASRIRALEQQTGVSMDYLHEMSAIAPAVFWRFAVFMHLSTYRRALSVEAFYLAQLAILQFQDCGPCQQIVFSRARMAGVPMAWLQAVQAGHWQTLPDWAQAVVAFARAVVINQSDIAERQIRLAAFFCEEALVELAVNIGMVNVFPIVKRAMGHGQQCMSLNWEGARS